MHTPLVVHFLDGELFLLVLSQIDEQVGGVGAHAALLRARHTRVVKVVPLFVVAVLAKRRV